MAKDVNLIIVVFFCHGELMASKTTPTKCVQSEITKNADDFCGVCSCSFKMQYGNNNKISVIAKENLYELSKKKERVALRWSK